MCPLLVTVVKANVIAVKLMQNEAFINLLRSIMLSSDISLYLLLSRQVNTERQGTAEHANNIMEYKLKMKGFLIYQFTKCLYRYVFL